jgi:hypothetical protein
MNSDFAHETERQSFIRRIVSASKLPEKESARLAQKLWAMRKESAQLAENACNRELGKYEDKRDDFLDAKVKVIGEKLGLRAYRQGDPRGHTIRVVVGKEHANN